MTLSLPAVPPPCRWESRYASISYVFCPPRPTLSYAVSYDPFVSYESSEKLRNGIGHRDNRSKSHRRIEICCP
jgi:hypothetical protein